MPPSMNPRVRPQSLEGCTTSAGSALRAPASLGEPCTLQRREADPTCNEWDGVADMRYGRRNQEPKRA